MEGILLLNKPKGMTSHDCVFKIRKLLREKRVGHTGTLDPDVTGVLPICVGRATKVVEYITNDSKTYVGEVTLGFSTTTEDKSGEVVNEKSVDRVIMRSEIEEVLKQLTGNIKQIPPMYSAVKINGKKLYEYARQGIEIERPARDIFIHEFVLLDDREVFEGENISFSFKVTCSKGTYVRTLAVQIGELLGFPSHMSDLVRTASGEFNLESCITFEEIERMLEEGTINDAFITMDEALSLFPHITVNEKEEQIVRNGGFLPIPKDMLQCERIVIYNSVGRTIAIYIKHSTKVGMMKPEKVLVNNQELIE